jgi:GT2 family glycosyltransferase
MLGFNLGLHRLDRRRADRLCLEGYWNSERARTVPWALGACLLLRRSAFVAVGGFDPAQWLYAEDLDLGWRLHRSGWVTRYVPGAVVRHHASAATEAAFGAQRRARYLTATYDVLARHHGRARSRATAAVNIAGAAVRLAWMAPLALASRRWRARWADTRTWLRGHVQALRAGSTLRKQW